MPGSLQVRKGPNPGGPNPGDRFNLKPDKTIIGRNVDCDVVINQPAVSREHATISWQDGHYWIIDNNSRNHTFVNDKEINNLTQLNENDEIRICDTVMVFSESSQKIPLPEDILKHKTEELQEEGSSIVEATLNQSSKQILETQPAERLALLLDITTKLTESLDLERIMPKIVESLFQVFRQADRCFVVFGTAGSDKLIPKVIKTRRGHDETSARFSRSVVRSCIDTGKAILSEDASSDQRFNLSQSIADCRIRSVMCAPLKGKSSETFGVIQLDTQDRSKKFREDDLKLLMAVTWQAAIALENARMLEEQIARAGLERDLKLAHQVQRSFLPKELPSVPGYEFFAFYDSAMEVGGDYYDFVPLPNGKLAVLVGDVAGKGVSAALLAAKLRSDARFSLLTKSGPAEMVTHLNDLMEEAAALDRFVTLVTALLDPVNHTLTLVDAGHCRPLVFRKNLGTLVEGFERDFGGFPLGVMPGYIYESHTINLGPGDSLVFYSDGVPDARNKENQDFQVEQIIAALQNAPKTPKAMGERLIASIRQYAEGASQYDDITLVCVGRNP